MSHTLDKIQQQLKSKKAFTQSRNYGVLDRSQFPKYHWELYPLMQDYYHELNPYFVGNLYRKELLKFSDVITVRDGKIAFANFIISNLEHIISSKQHFLIPEDYSSLIPSTIKDQFACWSLGLNEKVGLRDAKKVIIFGLMMEKYVGPVDELKKKLTNDFKSISPDAEVELLLPLRNDPFQSQHKENYLHFDIYNIIVEALAGRKFKIIKQENFLDRTIGSETYLYDLKYDNLIVADSFLHYFFASKGAGINLLSDKIPSDSLMSLSISFWHKLYIKPLKFVDNSKFGELLFYKRLNNRHLLQDKNFHALISG